jgi:DNA-binding IclR family transcriptional regulator
MEGQGLATREIAAIIGLSARATRTRLARLIDRGLVRENGSGRITTMSPIEPGSLYANHPRFKTLLARAEATTDDGRGGYNVSTPV